MIAKPSIRNFPVPMDGDNNIFLSRLLDHQLNKAKDFISFGSKLLNVAIDDYGSLLRSVYLISSPNEYLPYSIASLIPLSFHLANTGWDISSQYIKAEYELLSLLALPLDATNQ